MELDLNKLLVSKLMAKSTQLSRNKLGIKAWSDKYIPDYFFRGGCELHVKLQERIDNLNVVRGQKEVFQAPRGYAKTTWASFATPLQAACEATEDYIILVSDTSDMAEKYLTDIKDELEHNEKIRNDYPQARKSSDDAWNASQIVLQNGVCIEALGKGKNVRGRKHRGSRPTLFIVDDPQSNADIDSPRGRERDINWIDRELIPAGDTYTNYLFIGNNIHRDSIIGVLSGRPNFTLTKFAAIMEWPNEEAMKLWREWEGLFLGGEVTKQAAIDFLALNSVKMHEGSKVLWQEKETLVALMEMRAPNHHAFEAEKQNNPRDPSKAEFDESWFDDEVYYTILVPKHMITVGFCDPSKGKEAKKGDYTAIIDLHYCIEENLCYIEADIKRRPLATLVEHMIERMRMINYAGFGIEANGFQSLLAEEVYLNASEKLGKPLPIIPIENYGVSKIARINRLSIWFKRRFFRFRAGCASTKLLMEQILDHPNADHDDGPDALEGGTRTLMNYVDLSKFGANADVQGSDASGDDGLPEDNIFGTRGFSLWR